MSRPTKRERGREEILPQRVLYRRSTPITRASVQAVLNRRGQATPEQIAAVLVGSEWAKPRHIDRVRKLMK